MRTSAGLTHSSTTKGQANIPLTKNPNPKEEKKGIKSFANPDPQTQHRATYSDKKLEGWQMSAEDKKRIKEIHKQKKPKGK